MNDFKSYSNAKNGQTAQSPPLNDGNTSPNSQAQLNNTVEMAKIISKAMNGKSTMQIMQTIISEAERGKREGTLTNADLDNFYTVLSPLLDGVKRKKLKQVIERLKQI